MRFIMKKLSKISLRECENAMIISEKEMMNIKGGYDILSGYNFLFYCYCTEDGKHWADWMTPTEATASIPVNCGDEQRGFCTTNGPVYF